MGAVVNEEVKEYIINFATEKLNKCELFTRVFGKNFARKKIMSNLDYVYTNELREEAEAYYSISEPLSFITFTCESEEDPILQPIDIENDPSMQATCLHESIHAILKRNILKTAYNNINSATGIMERYENDTELGRGLNEGLTNWICMKAGLEVQSYKELTDYIGIIEAAIGEERVMRLGKGKINKNVTKQLGMNLEECQKILGLADELYLIKAKISEINRTIIIIQKDYESNEEKDNSESELEHFQTLLKNKEEEEKESIANFYELIYNKYYRKEFEELVKLDLIPISKMHKFDYFYNSISKYGKTTNTGIEQFKQEYEKLADKCLESVYMQAEELYKNGNLSGRKLQELEMLSNRGRFSVDKKFLNKVATLTKSKDPNIVSNLLQELAFRNELEDVNHYLILTLSAGNYKFNTFLKDGNLVSGMGRSVNKVDKQNTNTRDFFDFTIELEEDEQNIIKQFIDLKEKEEKKDPDVEINIIDRLIEIRTKSKISYYLIEKGNFLQVKGENIQMQQMDFAPNEPQLLASQKEGKFAKFIKQVKRKNTKSSDKLVLSYNINSVKDNKNTFKNEISDMSHYSTYTQASIIKDKQKQGEKYLNNQETKNKNETRE